MPGVILDVPPAPARITIAPPPDRHDEPRVSFAAVPEAKGAMTAHRSEEGNPEDALPVGPIVRRPLGSLRLLSSQLVVTPVMHKLPWELPLFFNGTGRAKATVASLAMSSTGTSMNSTPASLLASPLKTPFTMSFGAPEPLSLSPSFCRGCC